MPSHDIVDYALRARVYPEVTEGAITIEELAYGYGIIDCGIQIIGEAVPVIILLDALPERLTP